MNRSAPLARRSFAARRPLPAEKEPSREQRLAARAQRAIEMGARLHAAVLSGNQPATVALPASDASKSIASHPKPAHQQNRRLLDLARGMPCLMRMPGICNRDPETTVAAHSNSRAHGKAGARKADDQYSVWSCHACHTWLDQGPAPRAQKDAAFMRAHLDQVLMWRAIATDNRRPDADRRAARWALDHLNATPVASLEI